MKGENREVRCGTRTGEETLMKGRGLACRARRAGRDEQSPPHRTITAGEGCVTGGAGQGRAVPWRGRGALFK